MRAHDDIRGRILDIIKGSPTISGLHFAFKQDDLDLSSFI